MPDKKGTFYKAVFVKSAKSEDQFLLDLPLFTFIGRSNVGKSTLINNLVGQKSLMKSSKTPGLTRMVNYALVDDAFYLADVPGYGYASLERDYFYELMTSFFTKSTNLRCVYILIDSRRLLQEADLEFMDYLSGSGIPFALVFTKCDQLSAKEKYALKECKKSLEARFPCFETNMRSKETFLPLRKDIKNRLKA